MRHPVRALVAALFVGLSAMTPGPHKAEARVYAAASLTDVIAAVAKQFEPVRGSHVIASYGASNTLAQQLYEGAEPGVFVSARSAHPRSLSQCAITRLRGRGQAVLRKKRSTTYK